MNNKTRKNIFSRFMGIRLFGEKKSSYYNDIKFIRFCWKHWNIKKYKFLRNDEMMEDNEEKLDEILYPKNAKSIFTDDYNINKENTLLGVNAKRYFENLSFKNGTSSKSFEHKYDVILNQLKYEKILGTKKKGVVKIVNGKESMGGFPNNMGDYFHKLNETQQNKILVFWFSLLSDKSVNVFLDYYKQMKSSSKQTNRTLRISQQTNRISQQTNRRSQQTNS